LNQKSGNKIGGVRQWTGEHMAQGNTTKHVLTTNMTRTQAHGQ